MTYLLAVGVGMTAGTHVATWGMYKDSPHEGFIPHRYLRSIVVAVIVAVALALAGVRLADAHDLVPFFGVVYAVERVLTELWKYTLRKDDQHKYAIPMRLAVGGRVINQRAVRYPVGVLLVLVLVGAAATVSAIQARHPSTSGWLVVAAVGSVGGWFTALGGAWKDAPIEGFSWLKFPRSPLIALAWAIPVAMFTTNWLLVAVGAAGYGVATVETYKKFWAPHQPPGKFAGHPVRHPETLRLRRWFGPLYLGLWVLIAATLAVAFAEPHSGLLTAAAYR